jgi:hypothetical protein
MAAFASDEYELREVAPGEYEIVPIGPPDMGDEAEGDGARDEEPAAKVEPVATYDR